MTNSALNDELVQLLRCPVALQENQNKGTDAVDDPGRLRLSQNGLWLICDETGCKYPITNGLPVMLPEVGERYRGTPEAELPDSPEI